MRIYGKYTDDLSVKQINALFREHDESHEWPVSSRFNVTERAIRRIRRSGLECDDYAAVLDAEISQIVNSI